MLQKLAIYTPDQLAPLVAEGSGSFANQSQWIYTFLSNTATLVKRRPVAYRAFGPFWWSLKKMMQEADLMAGEPVDPNLVEQVTLGSPALDVAAAFAFQEQQHANMATMNNVFTVDTADGDTIDYTLVDEEMES